MGTASTPSPRIRVGIVTAPHIDYETSEHNGQPTFVLHGVRIGIGFHWDREETQEFAGTLHIIRNADDTETAVNEIGLEDYLVSVISSEMSSDSPIELLKAHAVISRSWAMRAIAANRASAGSLRQTAYESNGHIGYDVCADDHCQRYEGIRKINERAVSAVRATAGQVLTYQGEVCDTRFYKCCGGKTELFSTCWEDKDVPYLQSVECPYCQRAVERLKRNEPAILQCLIHYDQQTRDAHDWTVAYTQAELQSILQEKAGIDVGSIRHLHPLQRGASGRIYSLQIEGETGSIVLGKELKIRRALSRSCLYSSWFTVEEQPADRPERFVLHGHGWGHGVGLCQLGAAEMVLEGKQYEDILAYYYPNSELSNLGEQAPQNSL